MRLFVFMSELSEKERIIVLSVIGGIILLIVIIYFIRKIIPKIKEFMIKARNKRIDKQEELYCVKCDKISKKKYFCSRCDYNLKKGKERSVE